MKLSKIYSNNPNFKEITFNEGFNVIYGDVESKVDPSTGRAHEHNLGKSSLVHLLDFMLLKGTAADQIFSKHKEKFSNWVFFLEVKLNNDKFLTIRRAVNPSSKVSFKEHFSKYQNFTQEMVWDFSDLSINSKTNEENPKYILNNFLDYDVNSDYGYRGSIGYFLRTQADYGDVFKLNKFAGSDSTWKPPLFGLLGFNPLSLEKKYEHDLENKEEVKIISRLKASIESEEVYELKAAIEAKTSERDQLKMTIAKFDFYKKEQGINSNLIKNTEREISQQNNTLYSLSYSLEQTRQAIDSTSRIKFSLKDVKRIFDETKIYFPDALSRDYEDVERFTKQLTTERNKYLKEELVEIQEKLSKTNAQLKELNTKRKEAVLLLGEKDTFVKYQKYQDDLIRTETDIARFKAKLENAETIESYQLSVENRGHEIKKLVEDIKSSINAGNKEFIEIKGLFNSYFKEIMGYTALLIVKPNKQDNVIFETSVLSKSEDLTGKDDGYTFKKALCACFVLALLANYSEKSFFRFAYHDGIMESWGDNPKINFLELIRNITAQYGIQYIISVIKSDIPESFDLETAEIRRTLTEEDTLFGIDF